ncbi:MAG: cell division initiation protein [Actinomycetota bacterium]|jgi:cell division initiation protein|nr:cell division initiation protein [Actinomycetota bacterium]
MEISAREIHDKEFHDAWRGYNQEEVDDFLDKIAETLDRLQRENVALQRRLGELDQTVSTSRTTEDMLKQTLVSAQQAAEEAVAKAKAKADQLLQEAEERSRQANEVTAAKLAEAEADITRRIGEGDRRHELRKHELEQSIERLKTYETDLKERLKGFLEGQLKAVDTLESHARHASGHHQPSREAHSPPPVQRPQKSPASTSP